MKQQILKILYEQGPKSIAELADETGCQQFKVAENLADLVISNEVYLDSDLTFWFAQEVAA